MNSRVLCYTLYSSLNYGAFLQAYSLSKFLEENYGISVYFFKMNEKLHFKNKSLKNKIFKIIMFLKFKICLKKLKVVNKTNDYNMIVLGSDEIWNLKNNTFVHRNEFFGIGLDNKKIIAFAPSCNGTTSSEIQKKYGKDVLSNLQEISVRDHNSLIEISKIVKNKKVYEVLDPTMLIEFKKLIPKHIKKQKKDYILVYGYRFTESEVEEIYDFATKEKLTVYSIGIYQKRFKNIIADPFEFLYYIKNSKYVVTKTFHGSIFSILFHKKFIVYAEKNNIKINDLLKKLGLENRIIETSQIEQIKSNIDYKIVDEKIIIERKITEDFFKRAVGD